MREGRRGKKGWASLLILAVAAMALAGDRESWAASAAELDRDGKVAFAQLRKNDRVARELAPGAKAVLVFPHIYKAGFLFGGQIGEGVLLKGGRPAGYYNSVAASYGLQAGVQEFGYALFFMDNKSLADFESSTGFEVGVGPSIVVVDEGMGRTTTTTTIREGIYAFIFDQDGLMAGMGLQGSKITRIPK